MSRQNNNTYIHNLNTILMYVISILIYEYIYTCKMYLLIQI